MRRRPSYIRTGANSALGYLSPINYERRQLQQSA